MKFNRIALIGIMLVVWFGFEVCAYGGGPTSSPKEESEIVAMFVYGLMAAAAIFFLYKA